jgi:phenylalanyl-tRNA synthetase beta chain
MLISRDWLQSHFETELPSAESIADTLMLHSFEIEGIEKIDNDSVIDIDVLPNRAHDCLSYMGIAHEYSALTDYSLANNKYTARVPQDEKVKKVEVVVENPDQCYRYMARLVSNITIQESPEWLRHYMPIIGKRSINNLVDITNYIMFDTGNPMHVFDADKIVGRITVRNAIADEQLTTLSGEELELLESDLVIADDVGVLALAGVKGGTRAEVDENTKNIIIEVANFNPTTTRSTARRVKILTDASKRFENGISSELAEYTMNAVSSLIVDTFGLTSVSLGAITDVYPQQESLRKVSVTLSRINRLLGLELDLDSISKILTKLDFKYVIQDQEFMITIPQLRLDLNIPEDIIEEVGRVYGYHNIPTKNLDDYSFTAKVNPSMYAEQTIRNFFLSKGISDAMTYSFLKKGDMEVANPISSDKRALRKNLHKQLSENLEKNLRNADYLGIDRIMMFEIGRVYTKNGEDTQACIAIANTGKPANKKYGDERVQLEQLHAQINDLLKTEINAEYNKNTLSFSISELSLSMEIPNEYGSLFNHQSYGDTDVFHTVSVYPYITRDISFWAPKGSSEENLRAIVDEQNTNFLKKIFLFDTFEKGGKTSYAFSLIFQSNNRTLTDVDVDTDMSLIFEQLEKQGAEMR